MAFHQNLECALTGEQQEAGVQKARPLLQRWNFGKLKRGVSASPECLEHIVGTAEILYGTYAALMAAFSRWSERAETTGPLSTALSTIGKAPLHLYALYVGVSEAETAFASPNRERVPDKENYAVRLGEFRFSGISPADYELSLGIMAHYHADLLSRAADPSHFQALYLSSLKKSIERELSTPENRHAVRALAGIHVVIEAGKSGVGGAGSVGNAGSAGGTGGTGGAGSGTNEYRGLQRLRKEQQPLEPFAGKENDVRLVQPDEAARLLPKPEHDYIVGAGAEQLKQVLALNLALRSAYDYTTSILHPRTLRPLVIAHGPPGTGKTTIIRSYAAECGLPCVTPDSLASLGSPYQNQTARNINAIFEKAEAMRQQRGAPAAVVLLDEAEYFFGSVQQGPNMDRNLTLSTIKSALEGIQSYSCLLLCATTNHIDFIDPSIRGQRADVVYVGPPETDAELRQLVDAVVRRGNDYARQKHPQMTLFSAWDAANHQQYAAACQQYEQLRSGRVADNLFNWVAQQELYHCLSRGMRFAGNLSPEKICAAAPAYLAGACASAGAGIGAIDGSRRGAFAPHQMQPSQHLPDNYAPSQPGGGPNGTMAI